MSIVDKKLEVYRGDTFTFQMTVTDWEDNAFDLTGYTATFTAKITGVDAVIQVNHSCTVSPATGIFEMTLTSEDTDVELKTYDYYIQIENGDDPPLVYTIGSGKLVILEDDLL